MEKERQESLDTDIKLRIAGVIAESIVDGPGFRYVVFTQGCPHQCPGCHNPETHDFAGGNEVSIHTILAEIDKNPMLYGVTFSGGEPFCQPEALCALAQSCKTRGKHLMAYTGYTFEELRALPSPAVQQLLSLLDLLVDGRFVEQERDLTLRFRGSRNQRVLAVPQSLKAGRAIWAEGYGG